MTQHEILDALTEAPMFNTEAANDTMFHMYMQIQNAMENYPEVNAIYLFFRKTPDRDICILADADFDETIEGFEQSCELAYLMSQIFGKTITYSVDSLWDNDFGDYDEMLEEIAHGRFCAMYRKGAYD